jgi:hypothetical protein
MTAAIEDFWYTCKCLSSSPLILLGSLLNSLIRQKEL